MIAAKQLMNMQDGRDGEVKIVIMFDKTPCLPVYQGRRKCHGEYRAQGHA